MAWKALILIIFSSFLLVACSSSAPPEAPVDSSSASSAADSSSTTGAADSSSTTGAANSYGLADSSSASSSSSSTAEKPETAVTSHSNAGRPQGGKLVRLYRDPPTLDPHLTTDNISGGLVNEIFGGLVTLGLDLKVAPDLAERWDVSEDGRVYTFYLRKDAKFHDGKPVTAEDVRWSLERVADPNTLSPVAEQYLSDIVGVSAKLKGRASTISGLQVVDKNTIRITIDEPKSYFLAKLTYPTAFILDRTNVEGDGNDWLLQPNGTGPFKLAEYKVGEIIRLTRNEYYHLGPPNLDEVEFILAGGDPMIMYENDEIHLTGVSLADLERVRDPNEPLNAELKAAPSSFGVSYIGLNVEQPPLDDPLFRQALSLAIDRETISTVVLDGLRIPATTIIPPGFPSYSTDVKG